MTSAGCNTHVTSAGCNTHVTSAGCDTIDFSTHQTHAETEAGDGGPRDEHVEQALREAREQRAERSNEPAQHRERTRPVRDAQSGHERRHEAGATPGHAHHPTCREIERWSMCLLIVCVCVYVCVCV